MKFYADATEAAGGTPLVRIKHLMDCPGGVEEVPQAGPPATVLAKLEYLNPAGSIKDRVALSIISAAEGAGVLGPGGTIVEATSGNTGIALAWVGAVRGYRVILTMPETMSTERRALLRAYGAELVLTPGAQGMAGAVEEAERLADTIDGAILARQFESPANPEAHRRSTALEIWADTDGEVDYVVAGIGTGGTISGVGQALKYLKPSVRIIGFEPGGSPLLSEGRSGPHQIQGLGANFIPSVLDWSVVDQILAVPDADAFEWARWAATREGLFVGISSGAGLAVAAQVARREEAAGKVIVVILPDGGDRYLSTPLIQ